MKSRLLFYISACLIFVSCQAFPGKDTSSVNVKEAANLATNSNNEEKLPEKDADLFEGLLENHDAEITGTETEVIEPEEDKNEILVNTDTPIVSVENLKPVNVEIDIEDFEENKNKKTAGDDGVSTVEKVEKLQLDDVEKTEVDVNGNIVKDQRTSSENVQEKTIDENENVEDSYEVRSKALLEPRVSYEGAQVWSFDLGNNKVIKELVKLNEVKEISWWGGNKTAIHFMVRPSSADAVRDIFERERVQYDIVIADLQDAIDNENPEDDEEELTNRKGHRMTWQSYHRIADIHGYLDYLATTYPNSCSVNTIGSSVHGYPLKVLRISNGNPTNKAIWIDGGMHAREWISPATVTYIIDQLAENFEAQPAAVKNIDWYFLPVANPDGYEYTHMTDRLWRKNRARAGGQCAGTDLNRNFGYKWGGKGNSKNPCAETYGGSGAFSEPETRAIQSFFQNTGATFKAYLSFHSYGQYILYPWGYDRVVPPDYQDLETLGQKIAAAIRQSSGASYKVGSAANTLYPAAGGSDDWAKAEAKIKYAYTIELRDSGRYGFILPAQYIIPTAQEAFAGVKVVAEAVQTA